MEPFSILGLALGSSIPENGRDCKSFSLIARSLSGSFTKSYGVQVISWALAPLHSTRFSGSQMRAPSCCAAAQSRALFMCRKNMVLPPCYNAHTRRIGQRGDYSYHG